MLLAVCQTPETHLNLLEIVSLTKIKYIMDYTITDDLKVLNLMTADGSHAITHPCAYCISASQLCDSDAPSEPQWRQFDILLKMSGKSTTWRNVLSCSKQPILDSPKPVLLLCPPPPWHSKLVLVNFCLWLSSPVPLSPLLGKLEFAYHTVFPSCYHNIILQVRPKIPSVGSPGLPVFVFLAFHSRVPNWGFIFNL